MYKFGLCKEDVQSNSLFGKDRYIRFKTALWGVFRIFCGSEKVCCEWLETVVLLRKKSSSCRSKDF